MKPALICNGFQRSQKNNHNFLVVWIIAPELPADLIKCQLIARFDRYITKSWTRQCLIWLPSVGE